MAVLEPGTREEGETERECGASAREVRESGEAGEGVRAWVFKPGVWRPVWCGRQRSSSAWRRRPARRGTRLGKEAAEEEREKATGFPSPVWLTGGVGAMWGHDVIDRR